MEKLRWGLKNLLVRYIVDAECGSIQKLVSGVFVGTVYLCGDHRL